MNFKKGDIVRINDDFVRANLYQIHDLQKNGADIYATFTNMNFCNVKHLIKSK